MTKALNSDLDPQMTSKWPQIWYGGWNWDLVSAYQISCDSETKNIWVWFGRFCYCFDYKSGLAHPPYGHNHRPGLGLPRLNPFIMTAVWWWCLLHLRMSCLKQVLARDTVMMIFCCRGNVSGSHLRTLQLLDKPGFTLTHVGSCYRLRTGRVR